MEYPAIISIRGIKEIFQQCKYKIRITKYKGIYLIEVLDKRNKLLYFNLAAFDENSIKILSKFRTITVTPHLIDCVSRNTCLRAAFNHILPSGVFLNIKLNVSRFLNPFQIR